MSSKKAMKQAQKQAFAKHRSNITNAKINKKKKILLRVKKNNLISFHFCQHKIKQ